MTNSKREKAISQEISRTQWTPSEAHNVRLPGPPEEDTYSLPIWKVFCLILLIPVCSSAIQLPLTPSHGGIPALEYHQILYQTLLVGYFAFRMLYTSQPFLSLATQSTFIPVLASWIPVIQLWLLPTARWYGPSVSSVIIKLITWVPMQGLLLSVIRTSLERSIVSYQFFGHLFALASYFGADFVWGTYQNQIIEIHWVLTRPFLLLSVATLFMALLPSRLLLLAAIPYFHTLLLNPHSTLSYPTARLNTTLESKQFSLLAREEGLTGYLSVLENKNMGYRVLRCDHSLLGGEWVLGVGNWPGGYGYKGPAFKAKEPVYAVFIMLEAVRLVQGEDSLDISQRPDSEARALVM
jgi:hypothetical protein